MSSETETSETADNFNALRSREEEHVKTARSMVDSTIRNLLRPLALDDLTPYQMRRLAGVLIVASRRKDTALGVPDTGREGEG